MQTLYFVSINKTTIILKVLQALLICTNNSCFSIKLYKIQVNYFKYFSVLALYLDCKWGNEERNKEERNGKSFTTE